LEYRSGHCTGNRREKRSGFQTDPVTLFGLASIQKDCVGLFHQEQLENIPDLILSERKIE
jgi:hypothetical protein